jgi:hypothetical protein
MSNAITKLAAATAVTLVAGLGLTASAGTATAAAGGDCEAQSAPANTNPANQAPVATNDTVNVQSGTLSTIKPLANDTDPDGDKLYLENATAPRRGDICVNKNGTIDILLAASRTAYTTTFTYGITDGDRYRTATVTVNAAALKPMRPVLQQRLVQKKHGHKVKQRARVSFTNPNTYRMLVVAGDPKKKHPEVNRYLYPGHTFTFSTKTKRLFYGAILAPKSGKFITIVNEGTLNTANGHIRGTYDGFTISDSGIVTSEQRSAQRVWARR